MIILVRDHQTSTHHFVTAIRAMIHQYSRTFLMKLEPGVVQCKLPAETHWIVERCRWITPKWRRNRHHFALSPGFVIGSWFVCHWLRWRQTRFNFGSLRIFLGQIFFEKSLCLWHSTRCDSRCVLTFFLMLRKDLRSWRSRPAIVAYDMIQ